MTGQYPGSLQQKGELHLGCTPIPAAEPPCQSRLGHFQEEESLGGAESREDSLPPANTAQALQGSLGRTLPCSTLGKCISEHPPCQGKQPGMYPYYQVGISMALGKAGAHR